MRVAGRSTRCKEAVVAPAGLVNDLRSEQAGSSLCRTPRSLKEVNTSDRVLQYFTAESAAN